MLMLIVICGYIGMSVCFVCISTAADTEGKSTASAQVEVAEGQEGKATPPHVTTHHNTPAPTPHLII